MVPDTPILDGLRERIARSRPGIVGKMVIALRSAEVASAFEREVEGLGIAVARGRHGCQVEIDGAAIVWRHG